jgi:PAS domain S-box-containing protein
MKFMPGTLRARLVLLIILATIPSLVMLGIYVWQAQERSIQQTEQKAQTAVEILAASQKELILATKRYLQRLAGFEELQNPADPACSDFLRKALRLRGSYVNLGVPLPNGDLLCNALPMPGRVNVADRGYFQQSLRNKEFAVGDFQIDRAAKLASMNFSYPVLDPESGEVKGVVVAVISLDWWSRKLAEIDLPDDAIAIVTDANGTIIAHHPSNNRAIGLFAETYGFDLFTTLDGTQPSTRQMKSAGDAEPMIYAHRALFPSSGHASITVSLGLPYGDAIARSTEYLWRGVSLIFLGMAVILALTTWAMRKSVIQPLKNLLTYTKSLESGTLMAAPKLQGARELQSLQAQIVSMGETRLAAESELRQSEARFRQIAETIDEVFWIVSSDWKHVSYVNPAYEQVWQKSAESLYQEPHSWIDDLVAEDRPGVLACINQVESLGYNNIAFPLFRIERRDGTLRWISAKGFPVYNEAGELINFVGIAEDITERMQYEAELSEREAKYRLLVENAEDLVVKVDARGHFLFVSPSYCKTFGKSEHQLLGKAFMPMVHEEDQAATEEAMKALYYPPFTAYVEQRAMTVHGWRWFGWSDTSVLEDDGKVIEIIGVGRDITRQKEAEFALRASESRYRELVENMSDGVVVYQRAHESGEFIVKELNQAAERIAHCKREEILGQAVSAIFPGVAQLGLLEVFKQVADRGEPMHHPVKQYQDRRITIWVENYIFRLPSGEVVAVFKDLTAEKSALNALQASEEKFRGFFEKLPVGLVIADAAGQTIEINNAFNDILAVDRLAAVGTSLLQLLVPNHDRQSYDRLSDLLDGRVNQCRFQITRLMRSNRLITANVSIGVLLNKQQERVFIYGIIEDVTALVEMEAERANLQKELARTYRLEALGRLAGGIAHDFNNILGAIAGFIELTMARLESAEPQQIRQYLQHSQDSAERAKQLIRQLLLFSRGPEVQMATPQDFTRVVEHALEMTRKFLPSSIEFEVNIEAGPYQVNCDPAQIEQVLINLCINARDAMAEKGRIRIEVGSYDAQGEHCEICPEPIVGRWVCLSVADSGKGIDTETQDKIFEPFFTTKGREKGTGLGLSVVHGIVSSYGGHILLSSEAENGTCFRLLFPFYTGTALQLDESGKVKADTDASVNLEGVKVLLVDDEVAIRQLLKEALSNVGCEVSVTGDAEGALRQLLEDHPGFDILVTDQTMPHMTGIELIRRLREEGRHLPVILCSGYSEFINDELMEELKIASSLDKPVKINELLLVMHEAILLAKQS